MIKQGQIKAFYGLLSKLGTKEQKETIVSSFSDGRTEHVSELTFEEAKQVGS